MQEHNYLPVELHTMIFNLINESDRLSVMLTCRYWKNIMMHPSFWKIPKHLEYPALKRRKLSHVSKYLLATKRVVSKLFGSNRCFIMIPNSAYCQSGHSTNRIMDGFKYLICRNEKQHGDDYDWVNTFTYRQDSKDISHMTFIINDDWVGDIYVDDNKFTFFAQTRVYHRVWASEKYKNKHACKISGTIQFLSEDDDHKSYNLSHDCVYKK